MPARPRLRRHQLPGLRRPALRPDRRGSALEGPRAGPPPPRRAVLRGPHRRRCARVGLGRGVRRGPRARPLAPPGITQRDARAGGGRPRSGPRRPRFRRATLGALASVSLHRREPGRAGSVSRPLRVVGPGAARPVGVAARGRPVRRRARLHRVLSQASRGLDPRPAGARVAVGSTSAKACSATRSGPPRSAGRWCVRSRACSSTSAAATAGPVTSCGSCSRRDRGAAGQVAPPHGLCLWDVGYG